MQRCVSAVGWGRDMSRILNVPVIALATIVAGLVRQGITFEVTPNDDDGAYWKITLCGGY